MMYKRCPECDGTGGDGDYICWTCDGNGMVEWDDDDLLYDDDDDVSFNL